jgi:hypothetical protein
LIEAEVALGKRIETRQLEAHLAPMAHPNGAGRNEIELDAGKQTVERAMSAGKEPMRMSRLRRAGAFRPRTRVTELTASFDNRGVAEVHEEPQRLLDTGRQKLMGHHQV